MSAVFNPTLEDAMAAIMATPDLIGPSLRLPIARLLAGVADLHEPHVPSHGRDTPTPGCQWCNDEDWPCADMRKALTLARGILGEPDAETAGEQCHEVADRG